MKLLFVGSIYDNNNEKALINSSKVGLPIASNVLQWNIIDGFIENDQSIDLLGVTPIGSFPQRSKRIFIKGRHLTYKGCKYIEVGFINVSLLKSKIWEIKIKQEISAWTANNKCDDLFIIFYDLNRTFLNVIKWLKANDHCAKSCLIVPDLSGNLRNDMGYSRFKYFLLNVLSGDLLNDAQNADCYVFLTEQMNQIVNRNAAPYIVVDGVVSDKMTQPTECLCDPKEKVILYAGNLSVQYNIDKLLLAFESLPEYKDLRLWFCGKGNAVSMIIEAEKSDPRICYLGQISKSELRELEKKVSFFINPRTNNGEYTKYSFPSKNLEYLLAGRPVIAYKLDGMSDDYDGIFMYVEDESIDALKETLRLAAEMSCDEIIERGNKGKVFVVGHNGSLI